MYLFGFRVIAALADEDVSWKSEDFVPRIYFAVEIQPHRQQHLGHWKT